MFSLISVSDKDDCTLGNCAPYTFEIRGPHGPNAMRHAFTVTRHRDYTKCSNETTPFGCYSIRYTGDPQILRSVFKLILAFLLVNTIGLGRSQRASVQNPI